MFTKHLSRIYISYFKQSIRILIPLILITIFVGHTRINSVYLSKESLEPSIFETYNIETVFNDVVPTFIELRTVTITEGSKYQILDFVTSHDSIDEETIVYKEEKMGNYSKVGEYDITIVYQTKTGKILEKSTKLIIKTKPVTKTSTSVAKATQTKSVSTTTTKTVSFKDRILKDNKKIGTAGRLYFSSFYSVALYHADVYDESAQKIVDKNDSAAYFKYGNTMVIGDHSNQGFDIIKKQKKGNYVYIKTGKSTVKKYIIIEKTTGYNNGSSLVTKDGRDLYSDINVSLAMYTCNTADGKNVTIILLNEV